MTELFNIIDLKLAVIIIISSYWVKKNFSDIFKRIPLAVKVFIWSTLMSLLYYYLGQITGLFETGHLIDLLITYFFATSFYELFLKPIENYVGNWIDSKFGIKKD